MSILDQTDDPTGRELYRIAKAYELPGFVAQASATAICGSEKMAAHLYADVVQHQFPIHTAAATWVSSVLFNEKRATLQPKVATTIGSRLTAAAEYHQIKPAVEQATATVKLAAAETLQDSDFAYVHGNDRRLPLRNRQEVEKAAAWFGTYRDEFPYSIRQQIADKILTKAETHSARIPEHHEMLGKQAGIGSCPSQEAARFLNSRAALIGQAQPKMAAELRKIAQKLDKTKGPKPSAYYMKLANLVDELDRTSGVHRLYSQGVSRAEDVFFTVTRKLAADFVADHISTPTGTVYRKSDLASMKIARLRDRLGDEFAEAVTTDGLHVDHAKLAAVLPTMPRPDAREFDALAAESGIHHVGVTASANPRMLTTDALRELARLHRPVSSDKD